MGWGGPIDPGHVQSGLIGEPRYAWATKAIAVIDTHIPSLSDLDEEKIDERIAEQMIDRDSDVDDADFAVRTCACGAPIDGFYAYVDHLKEVIRAAAQT